jgi:hemimethylated DNA binding protein
MTCSRHSQISHRAGGPASEAPVPRRVFDVDRGVSNTEEWYENIPEESRPSKDQPFYHLLAENDQSYYVAYVSEQNLVPDETGEPVGHPDLPICSAISRMGAIRCNSR